MAWALGEFAHLKTLCSCVQSENSGLFVQVQLLMFPLADGHGSDEFV